MKRSGMSRRTVLRGSGALLAGAAFSTRVMAAAPPPEPVTPALIEAAKKEGQVSYYTSTDLPVAEKLAKAFEAKYPGIAVRVERTGSNTSGDLLRLLPYLANEGAARTGGLEAGQWITTGSWTGNTPAGPGSAVEASFAHAGRVSLRFA